MSDIIARLRALAAELERGMPDPRQSDIEDAIESLREAATTLVDEAKYTNKYIKFLHAAEKERDELKDKLAEAEHLRAFWETDSLASCQAREKAEAEAAALAHRLTLMGEALIYCRTSGHEVARLALERDEALSHPGPGAAYQERMRKLEELVLACREGLEIAEQDAIRFPTPVGLESLAHRALRPIHIALANFDSAIAKEIP